MNHLDRIRGRSARLLTRSSSIGQNSSNEIQQRSVDQLVKEAQLNVYERDDLYGVTGSVPAARQDIDRLVDRKRRGAPFDLLVLPDTSRFTRAGQVHGMKLVHDLRANGIDLFFNAENLLVADEFSTMHLGWMLMAANQTARAISRGVNLGRFRTFAAGQSTHSNRIPYGIDRLYSDLKGHELHVLRNLTDGRQLMLHPATRDVIRIFEANTSNSSFHYVKQRSETVTFIPGASEKVATLLTIFGLRYAKRWSMKAIARHLNDLGVAGPTAGLWYQSSITTILENPVYVGRGVRNRNTGAIYTVATEGEVRPSEVTYEELNKFANPLLRPRPRDEWQECKYGSLHELLPAEIREMAQQVVNVALERQADRANRPITKRKANNDRHSASSYILKNLLTCAQNGMTMTNRPTGTKKKPYRNYALARSRAAPTTANPELRRLVPADDLERQVLQQLRDALLDRDMIREAVRDGLARLKQQRGDVTDTASIEKQIRRLKLRLVELSRDLEPDADEDDPIRLEQNRVRRDLKSANQQRATAKSEQPELHDNPEAAADRLIAQIEAAVLTLPETPRPQDYPRLRALLEVFVSRLEADLVTRTVYMEIVVPKDLIEAAATPTENGPLLPPLCLANSNLSDTGRETHEFQPLPMPILTLPEGWFSDAVPVAAVTCPYIPQLECVGGVCFQCRRRRPAA